MIPKSIPQITYADIKILINNSVIESRTPDYKRNLPGNSDSEKREFLADIASFANAAGGDLIFGLGDKKDAAGTNTGRPEYFGISSELNADVEIQRLQNIIREGLSPKLPFVEIKFIDAEANGPVVIVRTPKSWAAPHMVVFKSTSPFYSRSSIGKQSLDIHEIRNAFHGGEHLTNKIQSFRQERLGRILANETPVPLFNERRIALHLMPYQAFAVPSLEIDLESVYSGTTQAQLISHSGFNRRYNLNGVLRYSNGDKTQYGYVQVYKNGCIESIEATLLRPHDDNKDYGIPYISVEKDLIAALGNYLNFYKEKEVLPPIAITLTLLNAKGRFVNPNPYFPSRNNPITEDHLILPDFLITDLNEQPDKILRPMFDLIWNACDYPKCPNYDNDGNWIDTSRNR